MKDIYVEKFSALIRETSGRTGTYLPPQIETYISYLLADHISRNDFWGEPVGLRYMRLDTSVSAKELGDNCLVISGVFPGYRGMSDTYYVNIGAGSYGVAASVTGSEIFETLARNFVDLKTLLNQIQPPKYL